MGSSSPENPLSGGAEGVSLRGGSLGSGQPTPAPLRRRGMYIFILGGAAAGRRGRLLSFTAHFGATKSLRLRTSRHKAKERGERRRNPWSRTQAVSFSSP